MALRKRRPRLLVCGIEPNALAREEASRIVKLRQVRDGDICDLPYPDSSWDLVFTSGVLIHIAPERIERAMSEVVRVARRWVLAIEYWAEKETVASYRGVEDNLWLRPYGDMYAELGLHLVRGGEGVKHDLFPDCHWWLFAKNPDDCPGASWLEEAAA